MSSRPKKQKLEEINNEDNLIHSESCKEKVLISLAIEEKFLLMENNLCKELLLLDFGSKVSYIYNPIEYAKLLHESYVKRFCTGEKEVLLIGMNPGPWGMCQTGVPFGHVGHVRDWLNLNGHVNKPNREHKDRPVDGLNCKRSEVSGDRMWRLLKELSGEPNILFQHIYLHNYCPLAFLSTTGKNVTPAELKVKERRALEDICDKFLVQAVKILNVKYLVGIGNYVVERAKKVFNKAGITNIQIVTLMHPSPANPTANKNWKEIALSQLDGANILKYFKGDF